MSTIDQAFVQAFARRNRTSRTAETAQNAVPTTPASPSGEMQVDPSVAKSTQRWVDPIEDQVVRADQAQGESIPQPHAAETAVDATVDSANKTAGNFTADTLAPTWHPSPAPTESPMIPAPSAHSTTQAPPTTDPELDRHVVADQEITRQRIDGVQHAAPATSTTLDSPDSQPTPETQAAETLAAETLAGQTLTGETLADETVTETADAATSPEPIQAVWEVDTFDVPKSVADLFFEESLFQNIASRLHEAVHDGLRSMMITSAQAGEGRSTVAIGMAMAAAASGLNVALIDGDVIDPTLVDDLRLDVQYGWLDAVRGGLPLGQVAVFAVEDGLTFIPLMPPASEKATASDSEIDRLMQNLNGQFDLIVVDAPSGDNPITGKFATLVDTAVIARDASRTDPHVANDLTYRLRGCGLQGIGIVENFA
ncbi:MAG: hypothetical protein HKN47_04200 [Pirellulaceae bacterium]|nr:hypothetical protein [Pirellulaceae bacterium]